MKLTVWIIVGNVKLLSESVTSSILLLDNYNTIYFKNVITDCEMMHHDAKLDDFGKYVIQILLIIH